MLKWYMLVAIKVRKLLVFHQTDLVMWITCRNKFHEQKLEECFFLLFSDFPSMTKEMREFHSKLPSFRWEFLLCHVIPAIGRFFSEFRYFNVRVFEI